MADEIDNSVKLMNEDKNTTQKIDFKDIIKPTPLKIFFPALIFVLIMIAYFVNSAHMPAVGSYFCDVSKTAAKFISLNEQIDNLLLANNADPKSIISLLNNRTQRIYEISASSATYTDAKYVFLANAYLASKVYALDPYYPMPCEAASYFFFSGMTDERNPWVSNCNNYVTRSSYECIQDMQNSRSNNAIPRFDASLEFNEKSFVRLLFHALIIAFEIYIISCIFYLLFTLCDTYYRKRGWLALLALVILVIMFFYSENILFAAYFLLLAVIFAGYFFKNEKTRKKSAYMLMIFVIISIIIALILTNLSLEKERKYSEESLRDNQPINFSEQSIIYCNSTKAIPSSNISEMIGKYNLTNETWNVCDNPDCRLICKNACGKSARSTSFLRGDKPSCICGC